MTASTCRKLINLLLSFVDWLTPGWWLQLVPVCAFTQADTGRLTAVHPYLNSWLVCGYILSSLQYVRTYIWFVKMGTKNLCWNVKGRFFLYIWFGNLQVNDVIFSSFRNSTTLLLCSSQFKIQDIFFCKASLHHQKDDKNTATVNVFWRRSSSLNEKRENACDIHTELDPVFTSHSWDWFGLGSNNLHSTVWNEKYLSIGSFGTRQALCV